MLRAGVRFFCLSSFRRFQADRPVDSIPRIPRLIAVSVSLLLMLAIPNFLQAQALYQAPNPTTTFPTGTTPQGIVAADFAHSGYQSMVVANQGSNTLSVYLATGPGTFATPTTVSTCSQPKDIVTADFNNDGFLDVAVTCSGASAVQVFLNNGSGGFTATTPISVPSTPTYLVAGDFNNDGYSDLAVAVTGGPVTVLLSNHASITSGYSSESISNYSEPGGITAGKFDSSGNLDLAVTEMDESAVQILVGDGTGKFTPGKVIPAQSDPTDIITADFNHDGLPDLAFVNAGSGTVSVCLGSGADSFNCLPNTIELFSPHAASDSISIAALDVNGDGNLDLATTGVPQDEVYLLFGNGDGTFQQPLQVIGNGNNTQVPKEAYPVNGGPAGIAVGDFNRDGKPDIAVTEQNDAAVTLLINNTLPTPEPGAAGYAAWSVDSNMNGNMADSIAVADFNRNGTPDTVISYLEDNVVRVMLDGNTATAAVYAVGKQPYDVVAGDLNGDGYPDLVTANTGDNTISVLLNNGASGNGTFAPAVSYPVGHNPFQVAIGDLNGDGIPDLAVTDNGDNTVSILYGVKGGTFVAGPVLTTGVQPYGVAIGDFRGDGRNDIAVTCYSASQLYVFPNNGNGTFGSPNIYSTDTNPAGVVVGDFNRDGKLDIVTGNTIANDVSFFAGNGDDTFQPAVNSFSYNFPNSIAVGDINGDGILDLATNGSNGNEIAIMLGKGDGSFYPRINISTGPRPWAVALADTKHDGKLDIETANVYNTVDLATVQDQQRYETQYPAVNGGNPSANLILNESGTTVTLGESPNNYFPMSNTTAITLTATVAATLGGPTPTGSVIFEDNDGLVLGTAPSSLSSGGVATLTLPNIGSGPHIFTALYSGDAAYQPNNTANNPGYFVFIAGTPTSLTLSNSTLMSGSNLSYTVTVGVAGDGSDPAGTVTLYAIEPSGATESFDSAQTLAGNGNGTASVSHSVDPGAPPGNYELYAVYTPAAGSTYTAGSSSDQPLTVAGLPTTTTLGCAPEIYFGFPTGNDECYSQAMYNGTVLQQGTVDFAINGGAENAEAIQDVSDLYSTPSLMGYYATYIFTAPTGNYAATAAFQPEEVNGAYYAGSSAAGSFSD